MSLPILSNFGLLLNKKATRSEGGGSLTIFSSSQPTALLSRKTACKIERNSIACAVQQKRVTQSKRCQMFSQGSVATFTVWREIQWRLCYKFNAESKSELISKIGLRLLTLRAKVQWRLYYSFFSRHLVRHIDAKFFWWHRMLFTHAAASLLQGRHTVTVLTGVQNDTRVSSGGPWCVDGSSSHPVSASDAESFKDTEQGD